MQRIDVQTLDRLTVRLNGEEIASLTEEAKLLAAYLSLNPGRTFAPKALAETLLGHLPEQKRLIELQAAQEALWERVPVMRHLCRGVSVAAAAACSYRFGASSLEGIGSLESDAYQLERRLVRAIRAPRTDQVDSVLSSLGRFLPGQSAPWVLRRRDRLCALFVAAIQADRAGKPPSGRAAARPDKAAKPPDFGRPFYGREEELRRLIALLASGERCVTIQGLGGAGKTSIALRLMQRLPSRLKGHRRLIVSLTGVATEEGLIEALMGALGLRTGSTIQSGQAPRPLLAQALSRPTVLLLDNGEDLAGVEGPVAALLGYLLHVCPTLVLLCTSRQPLGLPDERIFPLTGLAFPRPEELERPPLNDKSLEELRQEYPALAMLAGTLEGNRKGWQLTREDLPELARLLSMLEGMPLSIELMAAQAAEALSLKHLLEAHRFDLGAASGSARSAIAWAIQGVDESARRLLGQLSVFAGAFTPEDVAAVTQEEESEWLLNVLDDRALVCWVPGGTTAYRLLVPVREAASALLDPQERASLEQRHRAYYLALAEQAEIDLREPSLKGEAEALLERSLPEIQSVLKRAVTHQDAETAVRLASALTPFLGRTGRQILCADLLSEARKALESEPKPAPFLTATLHDAFGRIRLYQGKFRDAQTHLEIAIPIWRSLEKERPLARCLSSLGIVLDKVGEPKSAYVLYSEAFSIFKKLNECKSIHQMLLNISSSAMVHGEWDNAWLFAVESLQIANTSFQDHSFRSILLLAEIELGRGDFKKAEEYALRSLVVCVKNKDYWRISRALIILNVSRYMLLGEACDDCCLFDVALCLQYPDLAGTDDGLADPIRKMVTELPLPDVLCDNLEEMKRILEEKSYQVLGC